MPVSFGVGNTITVSNYPRGKDIVMKRSIGFAGVVLLAAASLQAAEKHPFNVQGLYSETCSCRAPCRCEMMGLEMGCQGIGAMHVLSGSYNGQDLSGMKAAYATEPGDWVVVYVQLARPEQAKAAREFLAAVYGNWGKVEAIKDAKIDIVGQGGNYTVTVDDGKIMRYQTKAVLGGDKKSPIAHTNIADPLNQTFLQGLSESGVYKDGGHEIVLKKGTNSYFNDKMASSGDL